MINIYTVEEVSKKLKITEQYVRKLIKTEKLYATKNDSKNWIISEDSVSYLLKDKTFTVNPDNRIRKSEETPDITAISFFSGAMGLDLGISKAGIVPILAVENNKDARRTIVNNNQEIGLLSDINECDEQLIRTYANIPENLQIDLFIGGPPCQAFSTAGNRKGFEDSRGSVLIKYVDLIKEIKPTYFVLENVRGLLTTKAILEETDGVPVKGAALYYILKTLESAGYSISFELYNAMYFGAPQSRERFVIVGKLGDSKPEYLTPTHSNDEQYGLKPIVTLREAIGDIQDTEMNYVEIPKTRRDWYKKIPEGGNWKSLSENDQLEAMGKKYYMGGGKTGFFRRLNFDKPSPTLVTTPIMPATDLIHPTELRPLSVEEYARIQGFPDDFEFFGSIMEQYRQIGNAVPLKLGEAIGNLIISDMKGIRTNIYPEFSYSRYKRTSEIDFKESHMNEFIKEITLF